MRVAFHPLAERELNEAAAYYDLERPGLGAVFLAEAERSTRLVVGHPHAAPAVRGTIRRCLLRRFPYALLYRIRGQEIRILAVMNLHRRPAYWVGRS
jgi:toxin ParE1/3/4